MFNAQQITSRLAEMSDAQLAQYARMHQNDPYILPLAASESKRRQQLRQSAMLKQQGPQPTVAESDLAEMEAQALPEDRGIGVLPAQNIQGMADGGIAGYAEGGKAEEDRSAYRQYAINKALQMGLDPRFVDAIFNIESGYKSKAKSKTGPVGIGQLTKRTAEQFGLSPEERKDPYKNMDASMSLMQYLFKKYKDPAKVAIAYNQGEGVLNEHLRENKGQLVPEKLHENVRTANKQEPVNYLKKLTKYIPISEAAAEEAPPRAATPKGTTRDIGMTGIPVSSALMRGTPSPVRQGIASIPQDQGVVYSPEGIPVSGGPAMPPSQAQKSFEQGAKEFGASAANLADTAWNTIPGLFATGTYPIARALGASPERAKRGVGATAEAISSPFGKAFGITQSPEYRNAPSQQAVDFIGKHLDKSAKWVSQQTGLPELDVANMQEVLLAGAPAVPKALKMPKGVEYNVPTLKKAPVIDPEVAAAQAAEAAAREKVAAPRLGYNPEVGMPTGARVTPAGQAEFPVAVGAPSETVALTKLAADQLALKNAMRNAREAEQGSNLSRAIAAAEETVAAKRPGMSTPAGLGLAGLAGSTQTPTEPVSFEGPAGGTPEQADGYSYGAQYAPDKVEEAKKAAEEAAAKPEAEAQNKSGFGNFTNEDILTMGLNMMMAQPGQPGGALSQLASNIGRSGIATLQAKREREKLAQEQAYKDLYSKYIQKQTEVMGQEPSELRFLRALQKDPSLMDTYTEMYQGRVSPAQYAQIYETARAKAEQNYDKAWLDKYPDVQTWMAKNGYGSAGISPNVLEKMKLYK